jgi:hypothetical protein
MYSSEQDWRTSDPKAYSLALRLGFIQQIRVEHGWAGKKPNGYWTKERCIEDAKIFKTRTAWAKKNGSAYIMARKNRWIEECCIHMISPQNPAGYWTKERCMEDAKQFNTRTEWSDKSVSAYLTAQRSGWREECCAHMTSIRNPAGYWTKERCMEDAYKFSTRTEWKAGSSRAYATAIRHDWFHECCIHMKHGRTVNGYWTKERCMENAKQFKTRSQWQRSTNSGYSAASKSGWIDECCTHMEFMQKPAGYWTKERCMEDAKQFKTRSAWQKGVGDAYATAHRNGWIDECCTHMGSPQKPKGYWTKERCMENARHFNTRKEWVNNNGSAVAVARKNDWLDQCCAHMKQKPRSKRITE